MSQPSPDARHVARAVDALTTQVRRIADTVSTPAAALGDAPTTTADDAAATCDASAVTTFGTVGPCILRAGHGGPVHKDARAAFWHGGPPPATDEDAQRAARRASLRVILDRASRGVILRTDEAALLRQHVEAEQHEVDAARAVAADHRVENRALREKLERRAQEAADEMARLRERATLAEARASQAEELQRIAHETSNRSEAERARAVQRAEQLATELEQAQAAIARVRKLIADDPSGIFSDDEIRAALDGTDQPTTTEQP